MDSELKIKIERPEGMTQEEAEELIYKALSMPRQGEAHQEEFQDPAMQNVVDIMVKLHKNIAKDIATEIFAQLDKEEF